MKEVDNNDNEHKLKYWFPMLYMLYFLFNMRRQGVVKPSKSASSNQYLSKIKNLSKETRRLLISRDGIG